MSALKAHLDSFISNQLWWYTEPGNYECPNIFWPDCLHRFHENSYTSNCPAYTARRKYFSSGMRLGDYLCKKLHSSYSDGKVTLQKCVHSVHSGELTR